MRGKKRPNFLWVPLLAVTLFLAITGSGYLPVPGAGAAITFMHLPVILAAVLSGPLAGAALGLVFGVSSWLYYPPHDALVQIVPRVGIGLVAGTVFLSARHYGSPSSRTTMGAVMAALSGSLTNTLGVTLLSVIRGYWRLDQLFAVIVMHGSIEALLAVLLTLPMAVSVYYDQG